MYRHRYLPHVEVRYRHTLLRRCEGQRGLWWLVQGTYVSRYLLSLHMHRVVHAALCTLHSRLPGLGGQGLDNLLSSGSGVQQIEFATTLAHTRSHVHFWPHLPSLTPPSALFFSFLLFVFFFFPPFLFGNNLPSLSCFMQASLHCGRPFNTPPPTPKVYLLRSSALHAPVAPTCRAHTTPT
jgi:hypothetical protein